MDSVLPRGCATAGAELLCLEGNTSMAQEPHPYTRDKDGKHLLSHSQSPFCRKHSTKSLQKKHLRQVCIQVHPAQISFQHNQLSPAAHSQSSLQANIWRSLPCWSDPAQLWSLDPSCTAPGSLQMWALLLPAISSGVPSQGRVDTQSCASCQASSVSHQIKDLPFLLLHQEGRSGPAPQCQQNICSQLPPC